MILGGDSIRVVHPLFQTESDGSIPISPLQFNIGRIDRHVFMLLNEVWHSRLPDAKNTFEGVCYGAEYGNKYYAVAWWSKPVARQFNGKGYLELRRMAVADDAPLNTPSRFIKIMRYMLIKEFPDATKLISYQDTDVHNGTIYKASGWKVGNVGKRVKSEGGWTSRASNRVNQSTSPKTRWEYDL